MPPVVEIFTASWSRSSNPSPERSALPGSIRLTTPPDTRRVIKSGCKKSKGKVSWFQSFKVSRSNESCAQNLFALDPGDRLAADGHGMVAKRFRARQGSQADGRCRSIVQERRGEFR